MKLPAQDIPHELVRLAVDFRTWRLAEGAQGARLVDINDRISELGEDEKYTADVVAKFGALDADQAISDLETIIANLRDALAAIRSGSSAWRVVASATEVVPAADDTNIEAGEAQS